MEILKGTRIDVRRGGGGVANSLFAGISLPGETVAITQSIEPYLDPVLCLPPTTD